MCFRIEFSTVNALKATYRRGLQWYHMYYDFSDNEEGLLIWPLSTQIYISALSAEHTKLRSLAAATVLRAITDANNSHTQRRSKGTRVINDVWTTDFRFKCVKRKYLQNIIPALRFHQMGILRIFSCFGSSYEDVLPHSFMLKLLHP